MAVNKTILAGGMAIVRAAGGFLVVRAQDQDAPQLPVSDPICTFFGANHDKFAATAASTARTAGQTTAQVAAQLSVPDGAATAAIPSVPGGSRTDSLQHGTASPTNTIDKYIFAALAAANVAPAPPTTDYEFVRRVTLDLTGRIPTPDAVTAFVNDSSATKRAALVDSLIGSPNWTDKWVVWFSDLFNNNSRNTQIPRYIEGVLAYNDYLRAALTANKPYDQMARETIATVGTNSWTQGEVNFLVGGGVTGGPVQDIWDQETGNTGETFLGISHLNYPLCHNRRGHLDSLRLWAYHHSRQ